MTKENEFFMKVVDYGFDSLVDGDGLRFVIFLPGCIHNCPGCQNPGLQDPNNYYSISPELFSKDLHLVMDDMDGITLSGGDPVYDPSNTMEFIKVIKKEYPSKNIWMYTGYLLKDIPKELRESVDVIVDGRYFKNKPKALYRGSDNQIIWEKLIENGKIYYKNRDTGERVLL